MESIDDIFNQIFDEKSEPSVTRFAALQDGHLKQKGDQLLVVQYESIHPVLFDQEDASDERMNAFLLEVMKEFPVPANGEIINAQFDSDQFANLCGRICKELEITPSKLRERFQRAPKHISKVPQWEECKTDSKEE